MQGEAYGGRRALSPAFLQIDITRQRQSRDDVALPWSTERTRSSESGASCRQTSIFPEFGKSVELAVGILKRQYYLFID